MTLATGARRRLLAGLGVLALLAVVAVATAVGLIANPQSAAIDGWAIGPAEGCTHFGMTQEQCDYLVAHSVASMSRAPGATIASESLHDVTVHLESGRLVPMTFSAHSVLGLVLVRFSDGTQHAALFGCAGVSQGNANPLCPSGGPIP